MVKLKRLYDGASVVDVDVTFADEGLVVSVAPDNLEAKLRLANILEETGDNAEALDIVSNGELHPMTH